MKLIDKFSPALIERLTSPRICRHLHIPLQSGSAEVLKAMRRPYDPERYTRIVEEVTSRLPDLGLGADPARKKLWTSRQAAHGDPPLFESREEPATDVSRGPRQENQPLSRVSAHAPGPVVWLDGGASW